DLLKVNVEKSELDVLLGIAASDWPKIRQLVIEVDEERNLGPILQLLARHGYEALVEQDALLRNTDLCYVYAIRPSADGRLVREEAPGARAARAGARAGHAQEAPEARAAALHGAGVLRPAGGAAAECQRQGGHAGARRHGQRGRRSRGGRRPAQ